jgi:hypothetical protein
MATWASLSNKQKKKFGGNKKAFKSAKKEVRSTGASITSAKQVVKAHKAPSPAPAPAPGPMVSPAKTSAAGPSKVTNINAYDTRSHGAGSQKSNPEAGNRLSGADIRELSSQGFSDKEVVDYVESQWRSGVKGGGKAQSLLNQYKARLSAPPASTTAPAAPKAPETDSSVRAKPSVNPKDYQQSEDFFKNDRSENISESVTNKVGDGGSGSVNQGISQKIDVRQDNDTITTIDGDYNRVTNTVDNSVKNTGGDLTNTAGGNKSKTPSIGRGYNDSRMAGGIISAIGAENPSNMRTNQSGKQDMQVKQDNDTITDIYGDNNTVTNNIDNSVRNYGGNVNNMSISYGKGRGPQNSSVVSDLTLMGLGKAQDSPGSAAKFVNMYSDINNDNQKKYGKTGYEVADNFVKQNMNSMPVNVKGLNDSINQSIRDSYTRSDRRNLMTFGDIYNYKPAKFKLGDDFEPVEKSKSKDIYDDIMDKM